MAVHVLVGVAPLDVTRSEDVSVWQDGRVLYILLFSISDLL